VFIHFLHKFL